MKPDIVIRNGTVVDGTGAPRRVADVAITGDVITAIVDADDGGVDQTGRREIDAEGRLVTPGFVDIHTHLDAQIAWDPIGTSSCWHGVTSVVMGNCGVTFAPCRPDDRATLAEMMESVEDIPADAILDSLAWDWETYGEYYDSIDRLPKGPNTGGLVGHCALRTYVMGERGLDEAPATGDDVVAMSRLLDEAMAAGALGVSTSRTFLHRVPDGRPVPGTYATADELLAFGEVLGRHRAGIFEGAMRLGERDNDRFDNSRSEIALLGEISRQSGRPVSFGLTQSNRRPGLFEAVVGFAKDENAAGAMVRPQTTARGVGVLYGLESRTPVRRCTVVEGTARRGQRSQDADAARRPVPPEPDQRSRRARHEGRPRAAVHAAARRRPLRLRSGALAGGDRHRPWRQPGGRLHRVGARDRRPRRRQHAVPQPGPRRGRADARRSARHARPRRCRCARQPDHGRQPADVLPHLLDPRTPALEHRGGHPPPDVRHRRPVRDPATGPPRARVTSPT